MADEVEIVVNLDNLTLGDLARLEKVTRASEIIEVLRPYVIAPPIDQLPVRALWQLAAKVQEQVASWNQAKN